MVKQPDGLETVQEGSERASSDDDGYAKSDDEEEKEDVAVTRTRDVQESVSSSSESSSESETEEAQAQRMASPEPASSPQPPAQEAKPKMTSFSESVRLWETSDRNKVGVGSKWSKMGRNYRVSQKQSLRRVLRSCSSQVW